MVAGHHAAQSADERGARGRKPPAGEVGQPLGIRLPGDHRPEDGPSAHPQELTTAVSVRLASSRIFCRRRVCWATARSRRA